MIEVPDVPTRTDCAADPINGDACAHHLREKAS